jgi:CheY-like chemotaxis protein
MKISLPVYKHPTAIMFVDDSASFIGSVEFQIDPGMVVTSFHDAREALAWLIAAHEANPLPGLPIHVGYDEQSNQFDRRTIALDLDQIYKTACNPARFDFPAVVVVDYAMPNINGLDFCRTLTRMGLPCKRILLSGKADETLAVKAFNEGVIDRYLKKSDPTAMCRLEAEIVSLQTGYFVQHSGILSDHLVRQAFSFLSDGAFATLVAAVITRHGFVEHFLFAQPPGILFLDGDGRPTLMVVVSEVDLISQFEVAHEYGAPADLLSALSDKAVVPFFWESGGMYTEKSADWKTYCRPAHVCTGQENFYWALFEVPDKFLREPVYSYHQFVQAARRPSGNIANAWRDLQEPVPALVRFTS